MQNRIEDFLEKLKNQIPETTQFEKKEFNGSFPESKLTRVNLNFDGDQGRYLILPFDSVVSDYPFVKAFGTYEINIPKRFVKKDGTEGVQSIWYKIPDPGVYIMKDSVGRIVNSLTHEDQRLLMETRRSFEELHKLLTYHPDKEMSMKAKNQVRNLLRIRNYTLFYGYCISHWKNDRGIPGGVIERSNFPALFVCTAKGFIGEVQSDITEKLACGEDSSFIEKIYNNKLQGREGALMFTINLNTGGNGVGFNVKVNHLPNHAAANSAIVPADAYAEMKDPLADLLGSQANSYKDNPEVPHENRKLFNPEVMKMVLAFIQAEIGKVKMNGQNGGNFDQAVQQTTTGNQFGVNTDPYRNPQAAHIDPLSTAPVGKPAPSFTVPDFGQHTEGDLPF